MLPEGLVIRRRSVAVALTAMCALVLGAAPGAGPSSALRDRLGSHHRVVDLMAVVTSRELGFRSIGDIRVARVTGTGGVHVLGWHRVLRGRKRMNPSEARIASGTHKIAFTYASGRDRLREGLAVMDADGSHLHVLMKPSSGNVFWNISWDAAGDRLLATYWRADDEMDVLTFATDRPHPRVHRAFSTTHAVFSASFVGWSRTTLLLQISTRHDYVRLLRDGKLRTLERAGNYLHDPVASPSGSSFVYSYHLYSGGPFVLREATFAHPHRFHRVTRQEAFDPQYSPGSARIFYSYRDDSGRTDGYQVHWAWRSGSPPHTVHFPGTYHSVRFGGVTNA
jgi:hypothetical protein